MYTNLINMCRLGRLRVTCEEGIRLLGRTYKNGEIIKYRRRLQRNWLRRNYAAGNIEVFDLEDVVVAEPEVIEPQTEQSTTELEKDPQESLPAPEAETEDEDEDEDEDLVEIVNQLSDETEDETQGPLPVIEAPLVANFTKESLEVLDFQSVKELAKPMGLTSNSKDKLIEKMLAAVTE